MLSFSWIRNQNVPEQNAKRNLAPVLRAPFLRQACRKITLAPEFLRLALC